MRDNQKYVAFWCPIELYEEILAKEKNMSKFIKNAIKSYKNKEYQDDLLNSYVQLIKLFKQISKHFAPESHHSILDINQLGSYITEQINNPEAIDNINKILEIE